VTDETADALDILTPQPPAAGSDAVGRGEIPTTESAADKGKQDQAEESVEGKLDGFSRSASKIYYIHINRYIADLERISRLKAKQSSMDSVSSEHVKEAASFLSTSRVTSRLSRSCETIGGLVLGAGISELITLVQDHNYSAGLVLVTAVLIGGGAAMIGIFLGRD
jgi:hypothetical protein